MPDKQGNLERWHEQARLLPGTAFTFSVPLHQMLAEAEALARFVGQHWSKTEELPGLEQLGPELLTREVSQDLLELRRAVSHAHDTYLFMRGQMDAASLMDQGKALLDLFTSAIEFVLDDGKDQPESRQSMCALDASEDDPCTLEMIATALDEYANTAEEMKKDLQELPGFQVALIEQAYGLVREMRNLPINAGALSTVSEQSLNLRNRLLQLLDLNIRRVRRAARFIFREHPEVLAGAVRTYHRRWRAAARRREMSERTAEYAAVWPEDLT